MTAAGIRALRGQIAPITAISLFGLSISLSHPLFGLLLERMGVSGTMIGVSHGAAAISTVLFAPIMPLILARTGIVPFTIASTLLMAASLIAAPLWYDYWFWLVLRVLIGFAGTVLFFASEYWIVGVAPSKSRGRIVAVYTIFVSSAFMIGPLLLGLIGTEGAAPFAVAAAITALGVLPIAWGRGSAPAPDHATRPSVWGAFGFFRTAPSLAFGVTLFGMIEFGVLGLLPVWAVRTGLSEDGAVTLLALFALGSIAFQWPLGRAADRHDRLSLLTVAAAICALAPLLMISVSPTFWALAVAMIFWGGLAVALYSLALVEVGARYSGNRLSEANAAIVLGYGLGAVAAPVVLGWAMDAVPPDGILWLAAALALAYLALLLSRRPGAQPESA